MINIDLLFESILRFCLISFVLLGAGVLALRFLKQPVERIRLIQISLLSVLCATLWCFASFKPTIDLAVLPANVISAGERDTTLATASNDRGDVGSIENGMPKSDAANEFAQNFSPTSSEIASDSLEEPSATRDTPSIETNSDNIAASVLPNTLAIVKRIVVFAFLIVSALHIAYLAFGFLLTRRLVVSANPLPAEAEKRARNALGEIGAATNVKILSSNRIVVPIASGILSPKILLPEHQADSFADPLELKHSLAHEWKHIEQSDLITWQLVSLCQSVMWIQPCYWMLRRELRISQDQIADQFATAATDEHAAYAATLVRLSQGRQIVLPGVLSMAGTKSNLYRRVEMLLNENMGIVGFSRKRVLLALTGLMICAGMLIASLQLSHAVAQDSAEKESKEDEAKVAETKDESPTETVEHFGYVFDVVTEKPIEGVTVTVGRMKSKTWTPIGKTESQTDADGKFLFSIPPEQLKLSDLYILFDIDHPDYAERHCGSYSYSMLIRNMKVGDRPWYEKLQMVPGAKISGRLVDENKNPIAGAHLRVSSRDERYVSKGIHGGSVNLVSDDEGKFAAVVSEGGDTKLSIIPFAHGLKHIELGEKRGDIGEIVLSEGVVAKGVIRNAKGEPMEGLWVNLKPTEADQASYEMLRSAKTNSSGEFATRPISPGSYKVSVKTKATGAIEKKEYANFHNQPPSAMFVDQVIEVTEEAAMKPFVVQAVPHVTISMQYYKPTGEIRSGHSPHAFYQFDGQRLWVRKARKTGEGGWEMMLPHGAEDVELQFMTNEHSALTIQFEGKGPSTKSRYRFAKIEEDIDNIKIVRYAAPILQVKIVDESGVLIKDAKIHALYTKPMKEAAKDEMVEMSFNQVGFEQQSNGVRKSSQIVPGAEFELAVSADGFAEQKKTITMVEGKDELTTVTLKKASKSGDEKKEKE